MMKPVVFIALIVLFWGCTKEVNIEIPGYKEQIVIDGRIETDSPPIVLISKSKDIFSPTNIDAFINGFVSGAIVIISDGTITDTLVEICSDNLPPGSEEIVSGLLGIPPAQLTSNPICGYTSFNPEIWGQVGKTYLLKIQYEGKEYIASTEIKPTTPLDALYWKPEENVSDYGFSWAKLSDPANQYDAYKWEVKRINKGVGGQPIDPIFQPTFNPVFDDDFFDGLTFDFFYENPMVWNDPTVPDEFKGYYQLGDTVVVKLSKMDRTTYEFLEKKYNQIYSAGNPFSTPINLPTNLSNGALGIWAGFSPWYDTLICQP
jgi:hypothetical protein